MEIKDKLIVREEFSDTPGARYEKDGDNSGETFLKNHLRPRFISAMNGHYILEVDLNGLWGSPSSFISGSFGLLSIEFGAKTVNDHLKLICDNDVKLWKYQKEINEPTTQ